MATLKPEATIMKQLNGHQLTAQKFAGRWFFSNPFPGFAKEHDGTPDTEIPFAEFERLARAPQPTLFVQEVVK